uniref:Uncharacterized protein n=1 Tax=Triticum urartu TaxID=4572 RepID=A0A8R7QKY5_TRIUA
MALVNKANGEALKHSLSQSHPVTNLLFFSSSIHSSLIMLSDACVHSGSFKILENLDISDYLPHIPDTYFLCFHTSSDYAHGK